MTMDINLEGWVNPKKIMVILAHPDDPEFFCGAAIARWCSLGHQVSYCLLTKGQRGSQDPEADPSMIAGIRMGEQLKAATSLGVTSVKFMDHMDGELVPDLHLREEIITAIRKAKPDIVVSCDPTNLFPGENRINHPDHRAAGQAVLDAVFPAVGNPTYRVGVDLSADESHQVEEVWLTLTRQPNLSINLTSYLDKKIGALLCHGSQVRATGSELKEKYTSFFDIDPATGERAYLERFLRIKLTP